MKITLPALLTIVHVVALAACGAEPRTVEVTPPLPAVPQPVDEVETVPAGPTSISLVAFDGEATMAWAIAVEIDDIQALPLDAPLEAGPATSVRLTVYGAGEIPVINEALCARLNNPSPACDREVTLYEVAPPLEVTGVLTLWSITDVLSGFLDAELADDESARGTFSIDL